MDYEKDHIVTINRSNSTIDLENGIIKTPLVNARFDNKEVALVYFNFPHRSPESVE